MTDQQEPEPEEIEMDVNVQIAVDAVGDPYVQLHIVTPDGRMLPADAADQVALKILAASAAARVRAGVVRDQLLAGIPAEEAVAFVNGLLHHD